MGTWLSAAQADFGVRYLLEAACQGRRPGAQAIVAIRRIDEHRVGKHRVRVLPGFAPFLPVVALPDFERDVGGIARPVDVAVERIVGDREMAPSLQQGAPALVGIVEYVVHHAYAHHRRAVRVECGGILVRSLGERGKTQPARVFVHEAVILLRDRRAPMADEIVVREVVPGGQGELAASAFRGVPRRVRHEHVVGDGDPASIVQEGP